MEKAERESIESVIFHTPNPERLDIRNTGSSDMLWLLEAQKRVERTYLLELRMQLCQMQEELYKIQRAWLCYQSLPVLEYEILNRLYEKHELWKKVEGDLGISHTTLIRKRKIAVQRIKKWCNSNMTNAEIIRERGRWDK